MCSSLQQMPLDKRLGHIGRGALVGNLVVDNKALAGIVPKPSMGSRNDAQSSSCLSSYTLRAPSSRFLCGRSFLHQHSSSHSYP